MLTSIALKSTVPKSTVRHPCSANGRPLRSALVVVTVLAVLAGGTAGWFGASWFRAAHSESIELAVERDTVLRDARQAAINLTTLDPVRIEESLSLWQGSVTGPLAEEVGSNRENYARMISERRSRSESKVIDAAVAELDVRQGTARVLVGLDVTITPEQGERALSQQRLQLQMTRSDAGWKASGINPVGP
jgi:Mce-associated membrane protein